jgi:hypothetical protein
VPALVDLTGKRFDRLTVLRRSRIKGPKIIWKCLCACGEVVRVRGADLVAGRQKSCGCWRVDSSRARMRELESRHTTHGMSHTKTYASWYAMIQRCTNPKSGNWEYYGARGIRVCSRWSDFEAFYADMGTRPKGKELDRRNPNGDYRKSNCRWVTHQENMCNLRIHQQAHKRANRSNPA